MTKNQFFYIFFKIFFLIFSPCKQFPQKNLCFRFFRQDIFPFFTPVFIVASCSLDCFFRDFYDEFYLNNHRLIAFCGSRINWPKNYKSKRGIKFYCDIIDMKTLSVRIYFGKKHKKKTVTELENIILVNL